jgi:acetyl-CoA carboxylase alpha subunit
MKAKEITAKDVNECGIAVKIIKENKDGSANAEVKFNKEGLETLVQWGLVALLTAAIDEYRVRPEKNTKVVPTKKKVSKK